MSQTSLSVWFVCKLCRGSFGQVDAFIEHKKQKHFTQFQNTTCIVFEEMEHGLECPVITSGENELAHESNEPSIKIEVSDEDPINPFSWEIIDEPNLDLVEVKSELITYESEIIPDNENSFFVLKQPEQNPYVLLKRLTTDEIQSACVPQRGLIIKVEKPAENQPSSTVRNISVKDDLQFQCKLCSKQLSSEAQLRIHVGICALYHEDQSRFCVMCNRKFYNTTNLKEHRLRFHGTEEEKSSLYKFKCPLCAKQYQNALDLKLHLDSHEEEKQKIETSNPKLLKCSHANCEKKFGTNFNLKKHISAVHLGLRPFSCHFLNCNKTFKQKFDMEKHFRIHTGERPFKCPVDNCNKAFRTSYHRSIHHRTVHRNL